MKRCCGCYKQNAARHADLTRLELDIVKCKIIGGEAAGDYLLLHHLIRQGHTMDLLIVRRNQLPLPNC